MRRGSSRGSRGRPLALAAGLYLTFFVAPDDYQQGASVKIMYLHVPAAWLGMMCYMVMTSAALGTLVWRHPLADAAQKAAAPLGAAFTLVCLVTGSLWGKPMWGTWWVWDARLTSVLVLFLIYLGLIGLWQTIEEPAQAARAAAILTLVGVVNIPIIKFSVDWWNTLHQSASVFRLGGPTIAPSMLWPLLIMALGFTLLFFTLHLMAVRNEILSRRLRRLSIVAASGGRPARCARRRPNEGLRLLYRLGLWLRRLGDRRGGRQDHAGLPRSEKETGAVRRPGEKPMSDGERERPPPGGGWIRGLPLLDFSRHCRPFLAAPAISAAILRSCHRP